MRIKVDSLIRIAKETTSQRAYSDKSIVAVYLSGSLLTENPFLGGTTDIDLIFIHQRKPARRREVVPLSPDIHLDIKHNPHSEYNKPRQLRLNPWLGPELWDPLLLFETGHFFEFIQAAVRDKFHDPINVYTRSQTNVDHARQIWSALSLQRDSNPKIMLAYLKAINHASNAVAILNGPVLAERRLLLQFPPLAEAAGKIGLADKLMSLLGGQDIETDTLRSFLPEWERTYTDANRRPKADPRLHPARLTYYKKAMESIIESQNPLAILWPLLNTWTMAAAALPQSERKDWGSALSQLGLGGDRFPSCLERLDHYLDEIEQLLADMAVAHGIDATYRDGRKV